MALYHNKNNGIIEEILPVCRLYLHKFKHRRVFSDDGCLGFEKWGFLKMIKKIMMFKMFKVFKVFKMFVSELC